MLGVPPKSSGGATNRCVMSRLTKCAAPDPFQTALSQACRARSCRSCGGAGRSATLRLYGAGGYPSRTRMSWLRAPIMLVIGASPEGPRPRPRRGRWSRLENRLGTWSRDSRLRLPRRASPAPGGRQLLSSRPSRRLEGRLLSDVAHDHLPRHADLVVVARLSNPHDGAPVLTPTNHDSNLGPVVPMRAVGNVVEARERIFALLIAPQHFRVRHDDQVNLMLAGKLLQGPQRKPGIFGRRQMGRPVVLDLVPGIDDQ